MPAFGFVQPLWFLALPALAAVGVLPHLIARLRGRKGYFSAVRFLQQAAAENRRKNRLRDFLLMLLRLLILALILTAFARPVVWAEEQEDRFDRATRLVIVLDRSASMGREVAGSTLFEQAVGGAMAELDRLEPQRDAVSVLLLDGRPELLLPGDADTTITTTRAALGALDGTDERAEVGLMLNRLYAHLQRSLREEATRELRGFRQAGQGRRELRVVIYSDMLDSAWREVDREFWRGLWEQAVEVRLERFQGPEENIGWSGLRAQAFPADGRLRVTVSGLISNHTDEELRVLARISAGDAAVQVPLDLPARSNATVERTLDVAAEQRIPVDVALPAWPDALESDNSMSLFLQLPRAREVWLLTDEPVDRLTSSGILARALATDLPADLAVGQRWLSVPAGVGLTVIGPEQSPVFGQSVAAGRQAEGEAVDRPDVLVISSATAVGREQAPALLDFVLGGGAVLWLADGMASRDVLAALDSRLPGGLGIDVAVSDLVEARRGLVPGMRERGVGGEVEPRWLVDHRAALGQVRLSRRVVLEIAEGVEADWLYSDGEVAMASRYLGGGVLSVSTFPLEPRRSDLAAGPTLVVFLHRWLESLPQRAGHPGWVWAGASGGFELRTPIRSGQSATWVDASGRVIEEASSSTSAPGEPVWQVNLPRLSRRGNYRLMVEGEERESISVNVPPSEGRLTPISDELLEQLIAELPDGSLAEFADAGPVDPLVRDVEREWWPWFMLAAVGLLLVEQRVASGGWVRNKAGLKAQARPAGEHEHRGVKGMVRVHLIQ